MNANIIKLYAKIIKDFSDYCSIGSIYEFNRIEIEKGAITFYFPNDFEQVNESRLSMLELVTNKILENKKYELFRIRSFLLNYTDYYADFGVSLEIKELEFVKNYSDNEPITNEA